MPSASGPAVPPAASSSIASALSATKSYFIVALLFSWAIGLLYLAPALYMLQVYDRALPSASRTTLLMLTAVLAVSLIVLAVLEVVRSRVLTRAGLRLDRLLHERIIAASLEASAATATRSQYLRDLDAVRQFVSGQGLQALFDIPWFPIYVVVIFIMHPFLGVLALVSALILLNFAVINEAKTHRRLVRAGEAAVRSYGFAEMSLRNSEVIRAHGMLRGTLDRWSADRNSMLRLQTEASDSGGSLHGLVKFTRLFSQSAMLGLAAYLVIEHQLTAGAMIAATILLGRALQPIELVVATWRQMNAARESHRRLKALLKAYPPEPTRLNLPRPLGNLSVEGVTYLLPDASRRLVLHNISFRLSPGEVLGVIGPSGAGKSTLARLILGVLPPTSGTVRLDGADVSRWPRDSLGPHVGYLPQDVELFADSVANNIGRFTVDDDEAVIAAAKLAGVHDLILRLPNGYDTQIGEGGSVLSGGLRQRIGLARAVYDGPALVVLDEPSSNLDSDGDNALAACLSQLRERGTTVVMISHRPHTMAVADKILLLRDGIVELFGTRAEVLARLAKPAPLHSVAGRATPPAAATGTGA